MKKEFILSIAVLLFLHTISAKAETLIANFDSFAEGFAGTTFQDGGITFSDLDYRQPAFPPPNKFAIENADQSDIFSHMTKPNFLTFCGYCPGPANVGISSIGSFRMSFDGLATAAEMDILLPGSDYTWDSMITLSAFRADTFVKQSILYVPHQALWPQVSLSISDALFDELRINVFDAAGEDYAICAGFDNVAVELIPEPCTLLLLGFGGLLIRKR